MLPMYLSKWEIHRDRVFGFWNVPSITGIPTNRGSILRTQPGWLIGLEIFLHRMYIFLKYKMFSS